MMTVNDSTQYASSEEHPYGCPDCEEKDARIDELEAALAERDAYLAKWQWIATHDAEPGRPVIVNRSAKRVLVLSNLYRARVARAEAGGGDA